MIRRGGAVPIYGGLVDGQSSPRTTPPPEWRGIRGRGTGPRVDIPYVDAIAGTGQERSHILHYHELKGKRYNSATARELKQVVDTAISGMGGESTPAEVSGDGLASRARLGGGIGNLYPHASDWGSGAEVGWL